MSRSPEVLEEAARIVESQPCNVGVVLASGLSRLLDRLAATTPHHGVHDVEPDPETGLPTRVTPDPSKPDQLKIDRCQPFAVISAFRNMFSRKANMARNAVLLQRINKELDRPGVYKLIGYWAESPSGTSWQDAVKEGTVQDPSKEDSFLIIKPDDMSYADFRDTVLKLGRATADGLAPRGDPRKADPEVDDDKATQDGVLVCDGQDVWLASPKDGTEFKVGTGWAASVIAKAYSRMRNKPNVPFVFAGTQQPGDHAGRYMMTSVGLKFFSGVAVSEYATARPY